MIRKNWARLVDALADRGVPLYMACDPLDDMGVPSWAVFSALVFVAIFALFFVLFPGVKYTLDVTTTPGARVTVSYGEERLTTIAEGGTASFRLPLGASATVKITMAGCNGTAIGIEMYDHYALDQPLQC